MNKKSNQYSNFELNFFYLLKKKDNIYYIGIILELYFFVKKDEDALYDFLFDDDFASLIVADGVLSVDLSLWP